MGNKTRTRCRNLLLHVDEDFYYIRKDGTPIFIPWGQDGIYKPVSGAQFMDKFFFVDGTNHIRFFKLEDLETMDLPRIFFISAPPNDLLQNLNLPLKEKLKKSVLMVTLGRFGMNLVNTR